MWLIGSILIEGKQQALLKTSISVVTSAQLVGQLSLLRV